MGGSDPSDHDAALLRRMQKLGPTVCWVGSVLGEFVRSEDVRHSLHTLAGHADLPGDLSYGERLVEHGAEYLPPRGGQPDGSCERLAQRQELAIESEDGLGDPAHELLRRSHYCTAANVLLPRANSGLRQIDLLTRLDSLLSI